MIIAVDGPAAEVYRTSPDEPWRLVRTKWRVSGATPGPVEGGGRASGYFTSATGLMIYRGNAFPPEVVGVRRRAQRDLRPRSRPGPAVARAQA